MEYGMTHVVSQQVLVEVERNDIERKKIEIERGSQRFVEDE